MKEMANKALRLGIIGAVAALMLAVVNNFTEPVIRELKAAELQAALTVLASGRTTGEAESAPAPGVVQRWPIGSDEGWILELEAVGYGGSMTVVASYDARGAVNVARLMDNSETVGFGKKAEDPEYMEIFVDTGGDSPVPTDKSALGPDADVVSGATVTFSGISEALQKGSELVKSWEEQ